MARYSKQREIVLRTVQENLIHPTADEVYALVRVQDPTISLGTIYRNLNMLAENGDILKIHTSEGADRYDGNTMPHHHVICRNCGHVKDYTYDFSGLKMDVLMQTGVRCKYLTVTLEGICNDCLLNEYKKL